jgi:hypothetical protein
MANFLLLYSGGTGNMAPTEEERQAIFAAWGAWFGSLGSNLVDGGNPFTPVSKSVASDGSVSDTPQNGIANGYSIIKADSLDAAVQAAQGCPVLRDGGTVTVYETFPVM